MGKKKLPHIELPGPTGRGLSVVEHGQIKDVAQMRRLDSAPILVDEFENVAGAIIDYFNDPDFPNVKVKTDPGRVQVEGMQVDLGTASETWIKVTFECVRASVWYGLWGGVARMLAENGGGSPRRVNLVVAYNDKRPDEEKTISVLLEVGVIEIEEEVDPKIELAPA